MGISRGKIRHNIRLIQRELGYFNVNIAPLDSAGYEEIDEVRNPSLLTLL